MGIVLSFRYIVSILRVDQRQTVGDDIYQLGPSEPLSPDDPTLMALIEPCSIERVVKFYRLRKGHTHYTSVKGSKRNNYTISFQLNNSLMYGVIKYFLHIKLQNSASSKTLAVIDIMDASSVKEFVLLHKVKPTTTTKAIDVTSIRTQYVCLYVGDLMFISTYPHKIIPVLDL